MIPDTPPSARPESRTPAASALPVEAVVPDLRAALDVHGAVVLEAPPGAGKTTRVPLALLEHGVEGRLVVLEPRRIAARAAARRLADQLGERVGDRVGLTTRDERRTSRRTRIEVVTEGVLLRRLQRDPSLPGIGMVLFDEFHERNLEADLALAFAWEARMALRPDLRILVASATLEGRRVARLLGDAPVVVAEGRVHPIAIEHRSRPGLRELPDAVAAAVSEVLAAADGGDVLVFLPGAAEIRRVAARLRELRLVSDPLVLPLHGSLSGEDQDAALAPAPGGRRKVVLATDVAESSLTIEGVTAVIDAGLSREPRFDAATGLSGLVTVPASRASADQRAGRAGRTAPGRCVRLWPLREHATRDAHPRPAVATDDLTGAALEVAAWGTEVVDLALLDRPPAAGWGRAMATLFDLGAVDEDHRITSHGRELAGLPLHPRLGHLLLRGRDLGLGGLAVEVAAVLADRDPFVTSEEPSADLGARIRALRGEPAPRGAEIRRGAMARARAEATRLRELLDLRITAHHDDPDAAGALVALGWPERIAAARGERRGSFVLAGGRGAELHPGDLLAGEPLLAVAHLDRGRESARIHLAAPIDRATVRRMLGDRIERHVEVAWRDGDVVAEQREQLGAVVLAAERLSHPDSGRLHAALLDGLREHGLGLLRWTDEDRALQARVALLRRERGESWPDLSDAALLADLDATVGPFLVRARRRADLGTIAAGDVLRARIDPRRSHELDRLVPTHLEVPSGSRVRLDYTTGDRPILAVRVQEMFGAVTTPTVLEGRVPVLLHLLSPARRPVQVTDDLAGFWERAYPKVRAELRGRYPKHAWPEDPRSAAPLRGTRRRR